MSISKKSAENQQTISEKVEYAKRNSHGVFIPGQPGVEELEHVGKYSDAKIILAHGEFGWCYGFDFTLEDTAGTTCGSGTPASYGGGIPVGLEREECLRMAIQHIRGRMDPRGENPKASREIMAWLDDLENPPPEQMTLFGETAP